MPTSGVWHQLFPCLVLLFLQFLLILQISAQRSLPMALSPDITTHTRSSQVLPLDSDELTLLYLSSSGIPYYIFYTLQRAQALHYLQSPYLISRISKIQRELSGGWASSVIHTSPHWWKDREHYKNKQIPSVAFQLQYEVE